MKPLAQRALLVAMLVVLVPAAAYASTCNQDGDCPGAQLCMAGRCASADCSDDRQCPAGRMCRNGGCRIRECDRDVDCNIERRCLQGICALPVPNSRLAPPEPSQMGSLPLEISLGPQFPVGILAEVALRLGGDRQLGVGLGSTLDAGGFGWRVALRQGAGALGPLRLDVFALFTGARIGRANDGGLSSMLLGSGRGLFDANRTVTPVFWGGGLGVGLPHGSRGQRLLRVELGALLLLHDRYPADGDFAALPCVGLRYGVSF